MYTDRIGSIGSIQVKIEFQINISSGRRAVAVARTAHILANKCSQEATRLAGIAGIIAAARVEGRREKFKN